MKNNACGAGGLGSILSLLNQTSGDEKQGGNFDLTTLISNLSQNGGLSNLFNLFKSNETKPQKEIISTDYEIKNYTRVE